MNDKHIDDFLDDIADYAKYSKIAIKVEYIKLFDTVVDLYRLSNNYYDPPQQKIEEIKESCIEAIFDKYMK